MGEPTLSLTNALYLFYFLFAQTQKTRSMSGFSTYKVLTMFYFHMGEPTLSSTLFRFTSEFGMESGGAKTLWSSGIICDLLLRSK